MTVHPLLPAGFKAQAVNFQALPPLSLYIHIPWCVRKCPYCDFNSHEARGSVPKREYVAALVRDLELALPLIWGRKVYTVFFGGGTPSLLSGESVAEVLRQVRMLLPLDLGAEITLEANPGTVEAERFAAYREAGVNRLSLGIQSFNDAHLQALGRIHNAGEARRAIKIAQQHFDNINLDLMYALPQQALEQALQDVQTALSFAPQHLSCYHLTLEPNTLFHRNPPPLPDDDASGEMQSGIEELLAAHGYEHYETSAFAQPKKQSRHNLNYWQFGDYLGIGAGAHSKLSFHDKVIRQARHRQPLAYLDAVAQAVPVQEEHEVSAADLAFEFMMNALRLNAGSDSALFKERTGLPLLAIRRELEQAERRGLLVREGTRIAPTELGRRFLNDLLEIFLDDAK
ncbi:MAG: YggW family oxidoreductase [Gallionellales bacterium RIFCSPLOWO2_12_FULL_59_22]|nr:MAG: YggW family oxidoreductase [Gallionellales bacterium RIFCSPLOWO2_02_FULL_59_110]OGT03793.1 MAG: YggW family oxidoreductase [Gallionellales bacterium RIFCSPLOWO2_02_58_13]OGT13024.1 MAG: YggW family oxidoreductase [Gallionellales bacterium RIFCSPLOWO2_12_FULL_59_22]